MNDAARCETAVGRGDPSSKIVSRLTFRELPGHQSGDGESGGGVEV